MKSNIRRALWLGVVAMGATAVLFAANAFSQTSSPSSTSKSASVNAKGRAICVLTPTEGNSAAGIVEFEETDEGVMIVAEITGLEPNSKHGFHIHQYGDISGKDGKATAGHFNPHGIDHAGPDADHRHVGDLGNLNADADGVARYRRLDVHVKMVGEDSIIGRGVIVHAGEDDLTSQPTGAAGARIAQGVIGFAKID